MTRASTSSTDKVAGYEAVLDGPASLFSQTQKYGIRMANFLPALIYLFAEFVEFGCSNVAS